jgi:hypothetical protein
MTESEEKVEILGSDGKLHRVLASRADDFHNGSDGSPLTDEQYDESKLRREANNDHLIPEEFR